MKRIQINKDSIQFDDIKIYPPFEKNKVDAIIGIPEKCKIDISSDYNKTIFIWNQEGVVGYYNEENNTYDTLLIAVKENKRNFTNSIFGGEIYIGKKEYKECKWKSFSPISFKLKQGCFEVYTSFLDRLGDLSDNMKEIAIASASKIEITYIEPKIAKYHLEHKNIEELQICDFNFKLAVIQELMYEKELLQPKFNIIEYCKEYEKRNIDIFEEGYEPINEVVDWFREIQIPIHLADEIEEIYMDGGNEIYHQIIPFWDGEDDYFDINKISSEELKQFKNLKKMTVMSNKYEEIAEVLEANGIESIQL